jgi:three-Cys-motif partner protein
MRELKEVSKAKHRILEKYFPAWARILGQYQKLVYVDCFAGAGAYENNEPGFPLIIFRLAKKLVNENKIKGISLLFIEKDISSAEQLQKNLETEDDGNQRIHFNIIHQDAKNFTDTLSRLIPHKWPAFFFIDPYGHPISFPIIKSILKLGKREVLLNLMWSGIIRNLENPKTINSITRMFGHSNWE